MELSNKGPIGKQFKINSIESVSNDFIKHFTKYIPEGSEYLIEKSHPEGQLTKYGFIELTYISKFKSIQDIYSFAINNSYYYLPESLVYKKDSLVICRSDPEYMISYTNEQVEKLIGLKEFKNNQLFIKFMLSSLDDKLREDRHNEILCIREQFENQFADLAKYFPMEFVVSDACISNSEYIWSEKYFYS